MFSLVDIESNFTLSYQVKVEKQLLMTGIDILNKLQWKVSVKRKILTKINLRLTFRHSDMKQCISMFEG